VRLYLTDPNGLLPATAGVQHRRNGMHVLRHTYASVLLDAGKSIEALLRYLGQPDPGFTLRVYTHLVPAGENRTRRAIDAAFADDPLQGTTPRVGLI